MVKIQHFSEAIEQNLSKIGTELTERHVEHESRKLSERERVSEVLKSVPEFKKTSPTSILEGGVQTTTPTDSGVPAYVAASGAGEDVERQIESLVTLAFNEGIPEAIAKAKKLSPFIEDAFHDALIDHVVPELKKRGLFPS